MRFIMQPKSLHTLCNINMSAATALSIAEFAWLSLANSAAACVNDPGVADVFALCFFVFFAAQLYQLVRLAACLVARLCSAYRRHAPQVRRKLWLAGILANICCKVLVARAVRKVGAMRGKPLTRLPPVVVHSRTCAPFVFVWKDNDNTDADADADADARQMHMHMHMHNHDGGGGSDRPLSQTLSEHAGSSLTDDDDHDDHDDHDHDHDHDHIASYPPSLRTSSCVSDGGDGDGGGDEQLSVPVSVSDEAQNVLSVRCTRSTAGA